MYYYTDDDNRLFAAQMAAREKAEEENRVIAELQDKLAKANEVIDSLKADIKRIGEKVKGCWVDLPTMSDDEGEYDYICVEALQDFIDNLVKEMVGDEK